MSLPRLVASLSCVLALTACGASPTAESSPSESTPEPTPTTSVPTPSPTPTITPSPSPTPAPKPKPTPAPAPPPAKDTPPRGAIDLSTTSSVPQFDNEATTVTCLFEESGGISVRCDLMPPAEWPATRPADCQDAYGDAIKLTTRARLICHGDTIWSPDTTKVIKKGQTYSYRTAWCTAASATEVTCRNADGHGFTITDRSYRVF